MRPPKFPSILKCLVWWSELGDFHSDKPLIIHSDKHAIFVLGLLLMVVLTTVFVLIAAYSVHRCPFVPTAAGHSRSPEGACFQIIGVLAALIVNLNAATASETFSIACETGAPARPFFVTFDTAARSAVLETPPTDIAAYSGINFNVGTISGGATKARLEFRLQAISGLIDLVFDHDRQTLIWPGINSNTIRPTLIHSCKVLPT